MRRTSGSAGGAAWNPNRSAPTDTTSHQPWRAEDVQITGPRGRWRLRFVAVLGILFFGALMALLIYVSLWVRPAKGTAVVLIGAGYEDNLAIPHNAYGVGAMKSLSRLADNGKISNVKIHHDFTAPLVDVKKWGQGLAGIRQKNILVYLAMHGGADKLGAYLFPQKTFTPLAPGKLEADQTKLRLNVILDRLEQIPANRNILLVLDATGIDAAANLGMIHDPFAKALRDYADRIQKIPNLVVLSASDINQRSHAAPVLGRSIFGHYFVEGLSGAADANRDNRVTALELHEFVATKVQRWAAVNRGALQTPVLFPAGEEGKSRARQMRLSVVHNGNEMQLAGTEFHPPQSLKDAWEKCSVLNTQIPGPETFAPALWREYRDTLLRFEQLTVAGDGDASSRLAARLEKLANGIVQRRTISINSVCTTLTMPSAAGMQVAGPLNPAPLVTRLWDAKPESLAKEWKKIRKESLSPLGKTVEPLMRLRMMGEILRRTANDPSPDLDKADELIHLVQDEVNPLPAEAHFLTMFNRDLPRTANGNDAKSSLLVPAEYIQLALKVRLLAERAATGMPDEALAAKPAATYSEQVFAWIRPTIAVADGERRLGQDLLFTSDRANWDKARNHLLFAQKHYFKAVGQAKLVREACAGRDQALALAPFYAKWIARRGAAKQKKSLQQDDALNEFEILCRRTHQLLRLLEKPPEKINDDSLRQLETQTRNVKDGFARLQRHFRDSLARIPQRNTPEVWQEIDDVLQVPFCQTETRMKLLKKRSQVGKALLLRAEDSAVKSPQIDADAAEKYARKSAILRGRVELALLGQEWFNQADGKAGTNFEQAGQLLGDAKIRDDWRRLLATAGKEIGLRRQQTPTAIAALLKINRNTKADSALSSLLSADQLLRQIDGAGNVFLAKAPRLRARHLQLQQFLIWQNQRTFLNHWYAEKSGDRPYFRAVCEDLFLADAKTIFEQNLAINDWRKKLADSGKLAMSLTAAPGVPSDKKNTPPRGYKLHLTSEKKVAITFEVAAEGGKKLPAGFPVVWTEMGKELRLANKPGQRSAKLLDDASKPAFRVHLANPLMNSAKEEPKVPTATESLLTMRGLFRGQHFELNTPVLLHTMPQLVKIKHPLPQMASVAVRASKDMHGKFGLSGGNVAIVLDASGSMGPPQGGQFGPATKYAEATAALRNVLAVIPKGTTVSLWTFGQAIGARKTVAAAERTIEQMLPPVQWNPDDTSQLQDVMKRIEHPALEPWNESAIVRTMIRAARDDLSAAAGFKALVVITDGMDNRIGQDKEFNPQQKDIAALLRENFRDIQVNIIGFKVVAAEQLAAQKQFAVIEDLPIPGKFYNIKDSGNLVKTLRSVFQQKLQYNVDRIDGSPLPGAFGRGRDVSRDGSNDRWMPDGLSPGNYRVRVRAGKVLARSFALNSSDLLLLELFNQKRRGAPSFPNFRRVLWSQAEYPFKPKAEKGNWLSTLVQNQRKSAGGVQMLVTLEHKNDDRAPLLQQIKPGEVWMEAATATGERDSFSQRWHFQPGYPAPAYSVDIPRWPSRRLPGGAESKSGAPANPALRLWWTPDAAKLRGKVLEQGHEYAVPGDLVNRKVQVGERTVVIDSVLIEDHLVETSPPSRNQPAEREKKPCLVVRISHPKNDLSWVRLHGLKTAGSEHCYFTKAGKCTSLFWPVTKEQADQVLRGIEVISVTDFKRNAERNNYFIEMKKLPAPSVSDDRPIPPIDLPGLVFRDMGRGVQSVETKQTVPRVVRDQNGWLAPLPSTIVNGLPELDLDSNSPVLVPQRRNSQRYLPVIPGLRDKH